MVMKKMLDRLSFRRRGRVTIPPNATFRLTQEGSDKIRDGNQSPQMRALIAIQTIGSSADVQEVASHAGMSRGAAEHAMIALAQKGYIQRVGAVREEE